MEKYLNYKGISPFPDDFDEFWNKEIRKADEFFEKELKYKMIKKDFPIWLFFFVFLLNKLCHHSPKFSLA